MNISQKELHNIIIKEVKKYLNEYADPRIDILHKTKSNFIPFIQHWCLIHYSTLIDEDVNRCKNHWKGELMTCFDNCCAFKLKSNNSYKSRLKLFYEAERGSGFFSSPKLINAKIRGKFREENIKTNKDTYLQCIHDLINAKNTILTLFAKWDDDEINEYINTI